MGAWVMAHESVQKTSSNTPVHRIERLVEMTDMGMREKFTEKLTRDLWY